MRKGFIILFSVLLILGVSGCGGIEVEISTQGTDDFYIMQEPSLIDAMHACEIVDVINTYNDSHPNSALPDDVSLEDAKEAIGNLWPYFSYDEDAIVAWGLIVIKDGVADLTPEGQKILE